MSVLGIRDMRNRDMVKKSKYVLPRFYGVVFVLDGKDIGSGSVLWDEGEAWLCLEITPELRQKPVMMIKVAKNLIAGATKDGGALFTVQDSNEPTSGRLLDFLGFKDTGRIKNGEKVLQWQK